MSVSGVRSLPVLCSGLMITSDTLGEPYAIIDLGPVRVRHLPGPGWYDRCMTALRDLARRLPRTRVPGLRTLKLTLAAVLAYVLAGVFETSDDRVLAPLTALLVVQLTLYQTLAHTIGRIVSVLAGVALAVVVADVVGVSWWSFGLLVLAALVVGQLLRLRDYLLEVPISAMFVLALGGSSSSATGRVVETLLGGAAGIAVNLLVAPPLHVRSAEEAVGELAERIACFLEDLADDLCDGWSRASADAWLERARALGPAVEQADRDLQRAEESARLHPRGGKARDARPRLRTGLSGLEHSYVSLRNLCRALLDRAYFVPEDQQSAAFPVEVREALADVLTTLAHVTRSAGAFSAASQPPDATVTAVSAGLREVSEQRDRLARLLAVHPDVDEGAWQQHGALLAGIDRLRVEVESAIHPPDEAWRPPSVTARPRDAVRRAVRRRGPARPGRR
jgi:hypothetical protein